MNNREWINTLSNEEMANVMTDCQSCAYHYDNVDCRNTRARCEDGRAEWLGREHKEELDNG